MRIGINQFCWPDTCDVAEAIQRAKRIGFDCFEACLTDNALQSSDNVTNSLGIAGYYNRLLNTASSEVDFRELKRVADDTGISIGSIGGIVSFTIYSLSAEEEVIAGRAEDAIKKMIDAANIVGADTIMVIPGIIEEHMRYEYTYDRVQRRIARLAEYAADVNLAIENVWNNFLYSPMELCRFVDETGKKNVGIYFDVANARRFGYPQQWIRTLGHRIKKLHIKDYRMSVDNINGFTNLLDGDVNYPAVVDALREIRYNGDLIIEMIPPANHLLDMSLQYAKNVVERLISQ